MKEKSCDTKNCGHMWNSNRIKVVTIVNPQSYDIRKGLEVYEIFECFCCVAWKERKLEHFAPDSTGIEDPVIAAAHRI